ncbi:MAG: hypothetical protein IH986_08685 [Planctomycetes bacterium]|nr:hypothetical protein [Planctomycetota bacterium]
MPFSGASDPNLPSNVIDRSLDIRKQWVGAWNGRFKSCMDDGGSESDCESSAFAVANAAIKEIDGKAVHLDDDEDKKKPRRKKPKDKMATMPDADKAAIATKFFGGMQLTQEETNYDSVGGDQIKACANCRWYLPYRDYDQCSIIEDYPLPITPNGISDRWEAVPVFEPKPMEVVIVGEASVNEEGADLTEAAAVMIKVPAAMKDRAIQYLRSLKDRMTPKPKMNPSFFLTKDQNGQLGWFAISSNNFRDSDRPPEIFEEKAHQEFVEYLDKGGKMPELWYWHTPGTKWGEANWCDYVDGFMMFSGTVDAGMEAVAEKVAADPSLGISHGYGYTYSDQKDGIIGWYRSFEISPLPMSKAANKWTGIAVIQKEAAMEFNAEKRTALVEKFGEPFVSDMESNRDAHAKTVADLKIESKQGDDPPNDGKPEEDAKVAEALKTMGQELAGTTAELILASKGFNDLTTAVSTVSTDVTGIKERLDKLEESDDKKVADILSGKGRTVTGQRASASEKNIVDPDDPIVKEGKPQMSALDMITQEMAEASGLAEPAGTPAPTS